MKTNEEIKQLAETIGAIQDTIRIHADVIKHASDLLYANIISLDLIYMDLVSDLPKNERMNLLQNQFDESKSGAENDLAAMSKIRDYYDKRINDCKTFIESGNES